MKTHLKLMKFLVFIWLFLSFIIVRQGLSGDLEDIRKAGKLRHLGIVYANFVTQNKTGLDVELMQQFARHLGVSYEFVETDWRNILPDLTGKVVKPNGEDIEIIGEQPIRGDIIATGFTVLPWREKIIDFSDTTFPTGVWLIARADSNLTPITPTGSVLEDISAVKAQLKGYSVLGLENSCLDPDLYGLPATAATIELFPAERDLNEMIPATIDRTADSTLMDVPVALIALETWPGEIKVVGPISQKQRMACGFPKNSPNLRKAFDRFFKELKENGEYKRLVKKYYSSVFSYFPDFLSD